MNVSYQWLRQYVRTDLPAAEAAKILSSVGMNVDDLTELPDGDFRLLVEVTSNRPDCLGHIGVARELAAALGLPLVLPEVGFPELPDRADNFIGVEIEELDLCPLYTARVIRGVKVGPSPSWLQSRLQAVGIRPVNNVVDVTNYVMMECGQPLHAFDYCRLLDRRIVVRRARPGEHFVAIDHSEHTLTPDRLVIADGRRPVALAGVMGGADTEISDSTTDVLLEAAVFDPLNIRTTGRALGMASESSYRFERRVPAGGTKWASSRACQLIIQVAGGAAAKGIVSAGRPAAKPIELVLRVPRLAAVLGMHVPAETAADVLRRLGIEVTDWDDKKISVRLPWWRLDLTREIDLIEEVARHYGYEKIPESSNLRIPFVTRTKAERVREIIGHVLTAAGYFEAVTFTFTTRDHALRFRRADTVAEPLVCRGTPLTVRQSVAEGLAESLRVNRNSGTPDARLFEVAKRFIPVEGQELPREETMLALASGDAFETVRGVLEGLFEALRVLHRIKFIATDRYPDLEAGACAEILLDGRPLGVIGVATKAAAAAFDLDDPPVVAELLMAPLVEAADLKPVYTPLPQLPAITRDLALVVDEATPWALIEQAIAAAGVLELESATPVDVYRGKQVPPGKKSVAVRLVLRAGTGTLTGDQADAMQARILESLKTAVGAVLRT